MKNILVIYPKALIVELAAIVFLIITLPVWLPLLLSLLTFGFIIVIIVLVLGFIISSFAKSDNLVTEISIFLANNEIILLLV